MTDAAYERRCTRFGLALFGVATALALLAVPWAAYVASVHREGVLDSAFGAADSFGSSESALRSRRAIHCAGLLALTSWPQIGLLWLAVWWKQDRERVKRLLPTLVVVLLPACGLLLLAAGVVERHGRYGFDYNEDSNLDFVEDSRARYAGTLRNFSLPPELWSAAKGAVCVLAGMGVVATNALRNAPRYRRSQVLVSVFTLVLGLAAYGATRAHASDAAHALPLWRPELRMPVFDVPPIDECGADAAEIGHSASVRVDNHGEVFEWGRSVGGLLGLEAHLRDRFGLWRALNPGKPEARRLLILAPPDLELETLAPVLAAAQAAGTLQLLAARSLSTLTWQTSTIGTIRFSQRTCAIPFDAAALPKTGTWGEWAVKGEARRPRTAP